MRLHKLIVSFLSGRSGISHSRTLSLRDKVRIRASGKAGTLTAHSGWQKICRCDSRRQRNRKDTEELHFIKIFGSRSRVRALAWSYNLSTV